MKSLITVTIALIYSVGAAGQQQDEWDSDVTEQDGQQQAEQRQEVERQVADEQLQEARRQNEAYDEMESERVASAKTVRRFHEVLDELLAEFGHDVRAGQINGLKNLAIRRVSVSNTLPASYSDYIELLVAERIRENSRIRLISCLPCKSKTSRLAAGKLQITSPTTNLAEMSRAADQLGIDHFMDAMLVYHTTHMVMAFQIFNADTKEMVWARTYNSETIKSRFQKLAVDYSQVKKSRESDEYVPEYRIQVGIGGAMVPNIGGTEHDTGMLAILMRGTEKFNNRKSEFGLALSIYASNKTFLKDYPTTGTPASTGESSATSSTGLQPFSAGIAMNAIYAHNFFGELENFDAIRHGLHLGIGAFLASSYFAPTARLGWDLYFGKRFGIGIAGIYLAASKVLVNNEFIKTNGGAGGEITFIYNF